MLRRSPAVFAGVLLVLTIVSAAATRDAFAEDGITSPSFIGNGGGVYSDGNTQIRNNSHIDGNVTGSPEGTVSAEGGGLYFAPRGMLTLSTPLDDAAIDDIVARFAAAFAGVHAAAITGKPRP